MKALLFDFDGIIVRSMEDHYQGWKQALQKYGIDMTPEDLYMMEGQGVSGVANEIRRKFNLPISDTSEIIRDKQEHYNKIKKIRFYPNLLDVLHWAKDKELLMAVVTGGNRQRVTEALKSFGLLHYFQAIVTSDDVHETKPDPEPYLKGAELLSVEPDDSIVIENAPLGIRSGKLAGMRVIAMTTTLSPFHLKQADVVVNNFLELLESLKKLF